MTSVEQNMLNEIKRIVTRYDLLIYLDFNRIFYIHTDTRELQLGELISQDGKQIAFYSRKLTRPQHRYKVTEK